MGMGSITIKDGRPWVNKFDPKYKTYANGLLQQVIDAGYRVDEIRYILTLTSSALNAKISALTLQSQTESLT